MLNKMTLTQSYEAQRDLLTGQVYKRGGTGVAERLYTCNERSELTNAALGSAPDTYAYDNDADGCKTSWTNTKCLPTGRAAEAQPMGRRRVNIGNRKTAQEDAEDVTYAANELNQYTDITTGEENFIPEYDMDGNQTRIKTSTGIWIASYNAQNRPVRFTRENTNGTRTVITAAYDYLGRRAWKKVETIATDPETGEETATVTLHQRYIYRGYLQVATCDLTRGGHPCLWLITWDPTQPIATRPLAIQKDGTWYAYGWDLTKNICEVFGQAGYIRTTYSYTPYGSVTEEGDVTQPLQWSSEYADPEFGLVYYNYRFYNPTDGRWIRRDFAQYPLSSLYCFVRNNPPLHKDFLGLIITPDQGQTFTRQLIDDVQKMDNRQANTLPSLGEKACSEYDKIPTTPCKDGRGNTVDDPYPAFAKKACMGFVEMYTEKGMLRDSVACVARCLVNAERTNGKYECCSKRNAERLVSHVDCYTQCGFIMDLFAKDNGGVPDGGWTVGLTSLLPDWIDNTFIRWWYDPLKSTIYGL